MKLDLSGLYAKRIDDYLKADAREQIKSAALERYGSYHELTIGRFSECLDGDFSRAVGEYHTGRIDGTWLQVYWMRGFIDFAKEYTETLKKLSPAMDADEERAASGLLDTTLIESILVFARNYFGMHSFSETENKITLGEILIAKKAVYNETTFRKKLANIQLAKAKKR